MAKKDKQPKNSPTPPGGWQVAAGRKATPKINEPTGKTPPQLNISGGEVNGRHLTWRLSWLDKDGPWSLNEISRQTMIELMSKMVSFESMTVGEIFSTGSEHGKSYSVADLPPDAARRMKDIRRDDEDQIHRLRCGGSERLYGIMREHVFNVLWWDPEHQVWPSKKKNT